MAARGSRRPVGRPPRLKGAAKQAVRDRAKNLAVLRQVTGLPTRDFADRLGIAPDTWTKYESGARRLTPAVIRLLALNYGVDPNSLDEPRLRNLRGTAFDAGWIADFVRVPYDERKALVVGLVQDRISSEAKRFVQVASAKGKLQEWLPAFISLFKRMAIDLDVRPPMELTAEDYTSEKTRRD